MEMNAVKAVAFPRLINPRSIWTTVVRTNAQIGTSKVLFTCDHTRDSGIALSLANAQVHLLAATVIEMLQNKVMIRTSADNATPPPGVPIAVWKMYGRA